MTIDEGLKAFIQERSEGAHTNLSRRDYFEAGMKFREQQILEALWKNGKEHVSVEEVKKIIENSN